MPEQQDLTIEQLQCGPMQNFVYLVGCNATREAILVDPAWDMDALLAHVEERGFTLRGALVTHYHPDHVGGTIMGQSVDGVAELLERVGVKIWVNRTEADGLRRVTGVSESDLVKVDTDEVMRVGELEIKFLHTPGHTPGSQCFLVRNALVAGDTLFVRGCGRVDLPGSDPDQMYESLRRLATLPEQTVLLPGHDYAEVSSSTIGDEKRHNMYLRIPDLETWRELMGYRR